jgi:hypothetical protein
MKASSKPFQALSSGSTNGIGGLKITNRKAAFRGLKKVAFVAIRKGLRQDSSLGLFRMIADCYGRGLKLPWLRHEPEPEAVSHLSSPVNLAASLQLCRRSGLESCGHRGYLIPK